MPCKIFLLFSRSKPTQSTQFKKTLFRTRIRILRSIRGRRDVRFDQKPKGSQRDPIRSHSRERLTCVPVIYVGYSDVFKKDSIISVHLAHLLQSGCRHVVCLVASSTGSLGEREPYEAAVSSTSTRSAFRLFFSRKGPMHSPSLDVWGVCVGPTSVCF